ncbi:MAG: nucleotidyltransferase domain-containing protein [Candidatus Berkelbacteria bacterium]|nr:nucleotidyltransferase domain-containing protein [Candidatus Berkelbacteria bacterium]
MGYRQEYLRRAKLAAKVLRFAPFVRMAGLNGSLVRGDEKKASDIDFLIIAKAGRLYTARFFAAALVHLTSYRRYGDKVAGRICLNCYLNDKNPNISPQNKKSNQKVANAYKYLVPLVDDGEAADHFFKASKWFARHRVSGEKYARKLREKTFIDYPLSPAYLFDWFFESTVGEIIEKLLMRYQQKKILASRDGNDELVATKDEIRLHPKK